MVSAMNCDGRALAERMNLRAESILIVQCDHFGYEEFLREGQKMRCYYFAERGVGLSRNNALLRADADLVVFADEDIVYEDGAPQAICGEFEANRQADMLLFNVKASEGRSTYWNRDVSRVRWHNSGRYPTYSFALRRKRMQEKNLTYSLLFGGGAPFCAGEDSLFLMDCLRAGLKVYTDPLCIGREEYRPSTWFHGYDRKYFHDRGVLYHFLYGRLAWPLGLRFLLRNRRSLQETPLEFSEAWNCLRQGIREAKRGIADGVV